MLVEKWSGEGGDERVAEDGDSQLRRTVSQCWTAFLQHINLQFKEIVGDKASVCFG